MTVPFQEYRRFFVCYLRPLWRNVLLLAFLLLVGTAFEVYNPQFLRTFIDTAQAGGELQALLVAALWFLAIALIQRFVAIGAAYVCVDVGWRATNQLRHDLVKHCLYLDLSFYDRHLPGELIERVDGDVSSLETFFSSFVIVILSNLLVLIGIIITLFTVNIWAGLSITLFTLLTFSVLYKVGGLATPYWGEERQANAMLSGFIEERLSGIDDIRANGAVPYAMRGLYRAMRTLFQTFRRARQRSNLVFIITNGFFWLSQGVGLALGVFLFYQQGISSGTAFLITYYAGMMIVPLDELSRNIQEIQNAGASLQRIIELQATPCTILDGEGGHLPEGAPSVTFNNVSFGYNGIDHVLHDISFCLPLGKVLGILGRTGSGKTTLTHLLSRLYDFPTGSIQLGETDIRSVSLADLRHCIGMVTQRVHLFHGTLRDNLTFFNAAIEDERLLQAIQALGLDAWYQALPNGLDSELVGGGEGLSAGEAQLLAFVRLLLKDPALVILDEASSRLDPATEYTFQKAVDRLLEGRSAIIIAHRMATVLRADFILVMENGRCIEFGAREQLAADHTSHFARLLQSGLEEMLV